MTASSFDEQMMDAALALATGGRGRVEPNPMVGCVITRDGRIIGRGFHERFGAAHAETNALNNCSEPLRGATAYVTLEPCCHTNKKTPPCVPKLVDAGIGRVVVGCTDPNPAVSGRGIAELRRAGIDVSVGIRGDAARQLIAPFFCRTHLHRPYVTLKWAQDPDGVVGTRGLSRQWISNPSSSRLVHQLRARSDAILVGINTVRADDPTLTVRGVETTRPLLRAVLDRTLSIPMSSRLVQTAQQQRLMIFCDHASHAAKADRVSALEALGAEVVGVSLSAARLDLRAVLTKLDERCVTHLLVEPGPTLTRSFIEANLADRAWIIYGAKRLLRTDESIDATPISFAPVFEKLVDGDRVVERINTNGAAFFAPIASTDTELITQLQTPKRPL